MKIKYAIIIALSFFQIELNAEIPIIAYGGIPNNYSTTERFKEFKEAGFDVLIDSYGDISNSDLKAIMDNAHRAGVRLILSSNNLFSKTQSFIKATAKHPALYGYFLRDEPQPKDFSKVASRHRNISFFAPQIPCYVNLLPNYGPKNLKNLGIDSYQKYLKDASTIGTPYISFDFYPITKTGIRETWYNNLEAVRKESIRTKKPFWAFVLSTPHFVYPQPTLSTLRLQIYSNLAYGAKAIQYFTYWTPKAYDKFDFHDAPISIDGKQTKNYGLVKKMNEELRTILPLFDGAEVLSVKHLGTIPNGCEKIKRMPLNIKTLKVKSKVGAIVSTIKNGNKQYLVVVNKDYQSNLELNITAENKVKQISKTLKEEELKPTYTINGGNMLIFCLN